MSEQSNTYIPFECTANKNHLCDEIKKRWDAFKSDMINTPAISHTVNMVYFDKSIITNKKGATFKKLLPRSLPFNMPDLILFL